MSTLAMPPVIDLGLTLDEARKGLQAATAFEFAIPQIEGVEGPIIPIEQLRFMALFQCLVSNGIMTEAQYEEALRLTFNTDLARREEALGQEFR